MKKQICVSRRITAGMGAIALLGDDPRPPAAKPLPDTASVPPAVGPVWAMC